MERWLIRQYGFINLSITVEETINFIQLFVSSSWLICESFIEASKVNWACWFVIDLVRSSHLSHASLLNLFKLAEVRGDVLPVTSFIFVRSWNLLHWLLVCCCWFWCIILFEMSIVQVLVDGHLVHYLFESLLVLVVQLILRGHWWLILLGMNQVEPLAVLVAANDWMTLSLGQGADVIDRLLLMVVLVLFLIHSLGRAHQEKGYNTG